MVPYTHTLCAAASEVSPLHYLAGLLLRPVLGVRTDAQALLSRRRAGAQLPRLLIDELLLLLELGLGLRLVMPLLVLGRYTELAHLRHLGTRRIETALARQLLAGVTGVTGGRGGLGTGRSCAPIDHLLHLVPAQLQPRKQHDRHVLRRVALARNQLELAGEDAATPAPPAWVAAPTAPATPAAPTWVVVAL